MWRATPEWYAPMAALYRQSHRLMGVPEDFTEAKVAEPTFRSHMWLTLSADGEELWGMLRLVDMEVSCVTVAPKYRRRGVGRAMLEELRRKDEPFSLTCLASNPVAMEFYRSLWWLKEGPTIEHTSRRDGTSYALTTFDFYPHLLQA